MEVKVNQRIHTLLILAFMVLSLVACNSTASKPSITIVSPPHGSQFQEGEEIRVQSTATDSTAIIRVELLLGGAVVQTDTPPVPQGQPSFNVVQTVKATSGTHILSVRAYNTS